MYIKKFIRDYYNLENGIFFNHIHDTGESFYTFNENIKNYIWNHAFPYNLSKTCKHKFEDFISNVATFYISRGRNPVVYLDEKYFNTKNLNILYKNKFQRFDNEAWMCLKKVPQNKDNNIKLDIVKITSLKRFNSFKSVIDECYSQEYSNELKKDFLKVYGFKIIEHFCYYYKGKLVGVSSVYYDKKVAHLHNVGVLKKYRGKGFGVAIIQEMSRYVINELKLKIYLQCDGGDVENFYKKLGAETFYRRYGYVLNVIENNS